MKKKKIISKCCLCGKSRRHHEDAHDIAFSQMGKWGDYDEELAKYDDEYDFVHSHGYCDKCLKKVQSDISQWIQKSSLASSSS